MCRDCGCQQANHHANQGSDEHRTGVEHEHEHWINGRLIRHSHSPFLPGDSAIPFVERPRKITLEQAVLAKNDRIAQENRNWFERHGTRVLNLISSPGSGKTLLLEKSVELLRRESPDFKMAILTGDQERDFDAQRLKIVGADVLQLNTVSSCHLDASMIQKELGAFVRPDYRLLVIENVGNLVCPAAFDLGENQKVALLSTPEGEDKPSKYPLLFHEASLIVLTKMDLVPYLNWNLELCEQHIRKVNSSAPILRLSAKTGEGMNQWMGFLKGTQIESRA